VFVDAFSTALTVAGGIAVVGAIVSFALVRPHDDRGPAPEGLAEIAG
jgi:hypothetical protein